MVSPFLGGGSFELYLNTLGIQVYAYDIFNPLITFWKVLKNNPEELMNSCKNFYPLSKEEFEQLKKSEPIEDLDIATQVFVLNRSSFSGTIFNGGFAPGHDRFTPKSINNLLLYKNKLDNIYFESMDYRDSLAKHPDLFAYLDPPYDIPNILYNKTKTRSTIFDHFSFYKTIKDRDNWMLSYNDSDLIRELYSDFSIIKVSESNWNYGMNVSKRANEILIFSKNFFSKYKMGDLENAVI